MIEAGSPAPLGATPDASGTNFAVYSSVAERIELCLFDDAGRQVAIFELSSNGDDIWHGYLPGCRTGQRYGFRADGPFDPTRGLRCNPAKLLIDPYARAISGEMTWNDAVFDYDRDVRDGTLKIESTDSAPYVPKSVVRDETAATAPLERAIPWSDTIFYEANLRGYTMRHPALDASLRGTFAGMSNRAVLDYLRALGITSLELMPVHAFVDEEHLYRLGLRNFWGYNPIAFFAPQPRYAHGDPVSEFCDMVRAIHDAGIEVILDVVYNHTAEGGSHGPALSYRGLDNLAYYSTEPGSPGSYINDTGCGNTLNADHPRVRQLVLDSLDYWHRQMGVDGFRFDLAPVLGRHNHGFSPTHPMLAAIESDPRLQAVKLIAEPWDPGPGGYQLGNFGRRWAEWNDRYRDEVRQFWRGDPGMAAALANRLRGSAELFESNGRSAAASVNLISTHDGFTLADVVSYEQRHNLANGEQNRDGHAHNYSCNYGVEGDTDDAAINALRRQQRLNMLATVLLSQGTPLLLAGDEFGHSQSGNNNAYAQDNETAWLDWSKLADDREFADQVAHLIRLRRNIPLLRLTDYIHREHDQGEVRYTIDWLRPDAAPMADGDWNGARCFAVLLAKHRQDRVSGAAMIVINGSVRTENFRLAAQSGSAWQLEFSSAAGASFDADSVISPAHSVLLLVSSGNPDHSDADNAD